MPITVIPHKCLGCEKTTDNITTIMTVEGRKEQLAPDMPFIKGDAGHAYVYLCHSCCGLVQNGSKIRDIRQKKRLARAANYTF